MKYLKFAGIISITFMLYSCESKKLENFEAQKWKNDRYGCNGDRKTLINTLLTRKKELIGFSEVEILQILGKPDMNDLRRRQQKFYYYYIFNTEKCNKDSINKTFKIRFNAIDKAQEILYE